MENVTLQNETRPSYPENEQSSVLRDGNINKKRKGNFVHHYGKVRLIHQSETNKCIENDVSKALSLALRLNVSPINMQAHAGHPFYALTVKKLRIVALEIRVGVKRDWKRVNILNALLDKINRINAAIRCQRYLRGFFVRRWLFCRGGKISFESALNETDFFTLDPIISIPHAFICAILDGKGFSHVFTLHSLTVLLKQATVVVIGNTNNIPLGIINPYTREVFQVKTVKCIVDFCFLSYMLLRTNSNIEMDWKLLGRILEGLKPDASIGDPGQQARNQKQRHREETQLFFSERRLMNTRTRIVNLFIDVDLLGNYSNINWFLDLNLASLIYYAIILYEIWEYRGRIPEETKTNICPFHSPFSDNIDMIRFLLNENAGETLERIYPFDFETTRKYCIQSMENMVYMSADIHYRKLGSMYVLMALTTISKAARNSLPWLYENLYN